MFLHYFIILKSTSYEFLNVLEGILYLLDYFQIDLDASLIY
jgi:hypothetical protein